MPVTIIVFLSEGDPLCLLHHAFEWVMELGNLVATIEEVKSHKPDGKDSSGNGSCRPWA